MTHKTRRIDNNIVKLKKHSQDKWAVSVNGQEISAGLGGIETGKTAFNDTVEALNQD